MYRLINQIRHYPWGAKDFIPEILGIENLENKPFAELWMSDRKSFPSRITVENRVLTLDKYIEQDTDKTLGKGIKKLPFLLKILSASKPLSIQLHPNKEQAQEGYERENSLNIPLDAYNRSYKDDNHKPEIIYALTEFTALKGFKPYGEIRQNFNEISSDVLTKNLNEFGNNLNTEGMKKFFTALMRLTEDQKRKLIDKTLSINSKDESFSLFKRLFYEYGYDIGVLSPFYLNIINLQIGEALFIDAGELHAYIEGSGIELMANSDNVIRGGLTKKHIDLKELFSIAKYTVSSTDRVRTETINAKTAFLTDIEDFQLTKINLQDETILIDNMKGAKILICTEGRVKISDNRNKNIIIDKGDSLFIPAYENEILLKGNGVSFIAN